MQAKNFGKYLRDLRKKRGLTIRQVQAYSGVSNSYISQVETGKRGIPSPEILQKLAPVLKVSHKTLMEKAGYLKPSTEIRKTFKSNEFTGPYPVDNTKMIPILGVIRCGEPLYTEQNILGYDSVALEDVRGGEYFFLKVTGDSMIGSRIYPGDKVLVRKQDFVDNGDIAVVMVNNEEATLKRVKYIEDAIILYPDNPKYQPQIYKASEVRIIGKVKRLVIDFY